MNHDVDSNDSYGRDDKSQGLLKNDVLMLGRIWDDKLNLMLILEKILTLRILTMKTIKWTLALLHLGKKWWSGTKIGMGCQEKGMRFW